MADSDEEYDRRRARDKFRRERSDYQERREDRGRREDFPERESWNNRERGGRREYRDYDPRGRRDRYSPPPQRHDISPPMKRGRMDWGDDPGYMGGGFEMGYPGGRGGGNMMGGPPGNWGRGGMHPDMMHGSDMEPGMTQPPMKTFKQFLSEQNDNIDDQEAVKTYNEYKQDFKKQQLSEFFITHKEEEWFKAKYQPEECLRRKQEQQDSINKRLSVFMELYQANWLDDVTVDHDKSEQIIRVLDAVVIKLEGGSDNDLRSLDEPQVEEKPKDTDSVFKKEEKPIQSEETEKEENKETKTEDDKKEEKDKDSSLDEDSPKKKKKKPKSRSENDDDETSDSDSSSSGSSDSEDSSDDDDEDEKGKKDVKEKEKSKKKKSKKKDSDNEEPEKVVEKEDSNVEAKEEGETKDENKEVEMENIASPEKETPIEEGEKSETKEPAKSDPQKPCPLHKTCSIFLRNLPPTITKQEVEAMFKKFEGYLRVAIADPSPERRFFRRGWVTYERNVNVKRICFEVSEVKLRDCDLGAIVNRDLIRRIRSVNGITSHKQVARTDIKIAVKIIQNLDNQRSLWKDSKVSKPEGTINLKTKNPLLDNISDYLIEEASAEEEELLGISIDEGGQATSTGEAVSTLERDETLIKVLDRLLFYLRIVHSIDYYNYSDYPNEDEMPNRCGIMHARGPPPKDTVTQQEIDEYISFFGGKIAPIVNPVTKVPKEEAVKLGLKEPQAEVEKFVKANSQEVGTGKWLCPLSGKKFKGPDFVRKHIFNKHHEKITEVQTEAAYFNNYLLDPKRPQLPEHPFNRERNNMMGPPGHMGPRDMPGGPGFMSGPGFMGPPFGGNYGHRGPMPMFGGASGFGGRNAYQDMHSRGGGNFGKPPGHGRNVNKPRKMISYNDLDEPKEQDFF